MGVISSILVDVSFLRRKVRPDDSVRVIRAKRCYDTTFLRMMVCSWKKHFLRRMALI